MLRNTLNCTLPIELVYNGEFEMNNVTCQRFEVGILCLPKAFCRRQGFCHAERPG